MTGIGNSVQVGEGIRSIIIYELNQSKFSEADQFIVARYAKYYGVPAFTYSVHTWLETKEALKAIGTD